MTKKNDGGTPRRWFLRVTTWVVLCFAFAVYAGGAVPEAWAVDIVVVANQSVPTTTLDRATLVKIFLKRETEWSNGSKISPIDREPRSDVRESFSESLLGRPVALIQRHWHSQIFSGRSIPPPEVETDVEVLEFVAQTPGAVGYVTKGTRLPDGVKQLSVTDD